MDCGLLNKNLPSSVGGIVGTHSAISIASFFHGRRSSRLTLRKRLQQLQSLRGLNRQLLAVLCYFVYDGLSVFDLQGIPFDRSKLL
jgi:hypothetical protein